MSKLEGGIFSRPRGKTGGIVFGAARTRRGKQTTTRLLVPPSNPNTQKQQEQRGKFRTSLDIVKSWGPDAYQQAFNRTVSQLPGFQSLLSIILSNIRENGMLYDPRKETLLRGSNPLPAGLDNDHGTPNNITWDPTPQPGGHADDAVFMISIGNDSGGPVKMDTATFHSGLTIADGLTGYDVPVGSAPESFMAIWTVGSGQNEGVFSNILYGGDIA